MRDKSSEYDVLKRNTIIIAISNIGSKAISLILAPLYSYFLSTEQYGTMDLIVTTCGLILPIICLDIYEAVFRYSSDNKYTHQTVLSSSLFLVSIETIITFFGLFSLYFFLRIPILVLVSIIYAEIDSYYQVVSQFVRGTNRVKPYAVSGIINSVVLLACNIAFVIFLRFELKGWIISFIIAKILSCVYVTYIADVKSLFSFKSVSTVFIKEALLYCIPLLPNAIMWWVMNLSDRFFIALYVGVAANGIYAVASKIPSILGVFENIFFQSWQISAINTSDKSNRSDFASNVFEKYMIILTVGVVCVLTLLRPIIGLFSDDYYIAWMSSGILVVAVMIHALGGNLGAHYAAQKNTKYALYTSLLGAITNIVLNIILIPRWGLIAAAITTLVGYLVVLLSRYIHLKGSINICVNFKHVALCLFLVIFQSILYYGDNVTGVVMMVIVSIFSICIYRKHIFVIL